MGMKEVKMLECSICHKTFSETISKEHWKKCDGKERRRIARIEKDKKYNNIRNSIRFKAEGPHHFVELINKYVKLRYKIDLNIKIHHVKYLKELTNSHHAPIGGVQNWGSKPGLPTGYPGYIGRVQFNYKGKSKTKVKKAMLDIKDFVGNNMLPGFNTGSGGGGAEGGTYELFLYIEDFPKIKSKIMIGDI